MLFALDQDEGFEACFRTEQIKSDHLSFKENVYIL